MGRILAQSRHPVVYGSPRPLMCRAMRAVLHRNIAMAIKMTCKGGVIFAIVDFVLCITITKQTMLCHLKNNCGLNYY
jgi:hypothetical protein